jgi:hypothetical protein
MVNNTRRTGADARTKGTGSVFPRGDKYVGVLPPHLRPPHQKTFDTPQEAHEWLDAALAGLTPHIIYLPQKLGEDATAKATEEDTTLSRVAGPAAARALEDYTNEKEQD